MFPKNVGWTMGVTDVSVKPQNLSEQVERHCTFSLFGFWALNQLATFRHATSTSKMSGRNGGGDCAENSHLKHKIVSSPEARA